jgi:dTDP-4-amino-4,6-dideoxygalactose transaminase
LIPYGKQSINESDINAVQSALRGELLTTGPLVEKFENSLQNISGSPTIVVSSGTAALHSAYAAIGVQENDEIITPALTFVATQATAVLLGARIVFADILPDTGNIDPAKVESLVTRKTKAIVAVDYAGHPADMDELRIIANRHKLFLIEDASHSIGSTYKKRPVGSLADLTTFSFFPTKNLTTGEGGAVSSPHSELLQRARRFSRQGLERDPSRFMLPNDGPWHQEVQEFGLNYRLPDVLCALGISQLERLEQFKAKRREIFDRYVQSLQQLDWLSLPTERPYVNSNWHLFPIQVPVAFRSKIFAWLRSQGIGVQVNYIPAYRHPAFRIPKVEFMKFPNTENFYDREISLPMHTELSNENIDFIVGKLREFNFS